MKGPIKRLELIIYYGQEALMYMSGVGLNKWLTDKFLRDAVSHNLAGVVENLKEYVNNDQILKNMNKTYPDISWARVIRFRDKMIHHYETLDNDKLYHFLKYDLAPLVKAIRSELKSEMVNNQTRKNIRLKS